jgi:hypothetical protein
VFLTVLSISFTIDSSFFSKVFILNSIWEKNFQGCYTQLTSFNWYNTYTIRLSIDSETSMRYAFPVRIWNFQFEYGISSSIIGISYYNWFKILVNYHTKNVHALYSLGNKFIVYNLHVLSGRQY